MKDIKAIVTLTLQTENKNTRSISLMKDIKAIENVSSIRVGFQSRKPIQSNIK